MIKLAIDPGKKGAIAMNKDGVVSFYNCPDSMHGIVDLIKTLYNRSCGQKIGCLIESVHAMPGQGVCSVWSFACNANSWLTAMYCCGIPYREIKPQSWMKHLGNLPADKKERKNRIKEQMQALYPDLKVTLVNADALGLLTIFDKVWQTYD